MPPYAASRIPPRELEMFEDIRRRVARLPDLDLGYESEHGPPVVLSCHILVHALAGLYPELQARDGYFAFRWQHSWLETETFNVIDAYPVGIVGGPILCHHGFQLIPVLYEPVMPGTLYLRKFEEPWFREAVTRVTEALVASSVPAVTAPA